MGIKTLGDIPKLPEQMLLNRLGKFGYRLVELSSGVDCSAVTPHAPQKSVSTECTLGEDTRSKSIDRPTQSSKTIHSHAVKLLDNYRLTRKLRLVGVGTSGFQSAGLPVQLDLFDAVTEKDHNWEKVDRTLETITKKFGQDAIKRATLTDR